MSQEGEGESHASRAVEGEAPVAPSQEVLLKQLADTLRQIVGVVPLAPVVTSQVWGTTP
ncbi:hypothetical protein JCGZ_18433 [Jatropha curcas]|uniref:Uncharacterized protein n=1 Tax=Jatropha curcas TaxID=180498 RepID=A0A067K493_JATCU|nr:hypothetical protein JCGZ_18433 [Jatropha curcas]